MAHVGCLSAFCHSWPVDIRGRYLKDQDTLNSSFNHGVVFLSDKDVSHYPAISKLPLLSTRSSGSPTGPVDTRKAARDSPTTAGAPTSPDLTKCSPDYGQNIAQTDCDVAIAMMQSDWRKASTKQDAPVVWQNTADTQPYHLPKSYTSGEQVSVAENLVQFADLK